ncbi:MAG: PilN domain-containing protein [Myxococcota bacterium]
MIRINLIAGQKRAARPTMVAGGGGAQIWAGVYLVLAVATVAVCAFLYFRADAELQAQLTENRTLETQIQQLRTRSARLEEVKAKLNASLSLEEVVGELNRGRTGPTRAMLELRNILSASSGPTIDPAALEALRRDNPLATFNRNWDARRLWLTRFEEEDRQVRIEGVGRTNEDVAEFLRRLQLSELFDQVTLQRTLAEEDRTSRLEVIKFELRAQVTY